MPVFGSILIDEQCSKPVTRGFDQSMLQALFLEFPQLLEVANGADGPSDIVDQRLDTALEKLLNEDCFAELTTNTAKMILLKWQEEGSPEQLSDVQEQEFYEIWENQQKTEPSTSNDVEDVEVWSGGSNGMVSSECFNCKSKWKYKCPKCKVQSCSLRCSKEHKLQFECDGVVEDEIELVKMVDFNQSVFLKDFRFLTAASKVRDRCKSEHRNRWAKLKEESVENVAKPHLNDWKRTSQLIRGCNAANIRLMQLPDTFQKHLKNKSFFTHFTEVIQWTVEWKFKCGDTFITVINQGSPDCVKVQTLLKQILHPKKHLEYDLNLTDDDVTALGPFKESELDQLCVLMKMDSNGFTNDSRYFKVELDKTLKENLQLKIIMEFPTLVVVLPEDLENFDILTDEMRRQFFIKRLIIRNTDVESMDLLKLAYFVSTLPKVITSRPQNRNNDQNKSMAEIKNEQYLQHKLGRKLLSLGKQSRRTAKSNVIASKKNGPIQRPYNSVSRYRPYECRTMGISNSQIDLPYDDDSAPVEIPIERPSLADNNLNQYSVVNTLVDYSDSD